MFIKEVSKIIRNTDLVVKSSEMETTTKGSIAKDSFTGKVLYILI